MTQPNRHRKLLTVATVAAALVAFGVWSRLASRNDASRQNRTQVKQDAWAPTTAPTGPIEMVPHDQFGRLRLSKYVPAGDLTQIHGWEFQGRQWVGEAFGFSEWLRPDDDPDVLKSLSIDFETFPPDAAREVLQRIGLPVRPGMSLAELVRLLGPRAEESRFVSDRITCDYLTPPPNRYRVSCTVKNDGGLIRVVVTVEPKAKQSAGD